MEELNLKQLMSMVGAIAEEKNLSEETVLGIIEQAIAAAWRRDNGSREQTVRSELNTVDGTAEVFVIREVVEEVENEINQISLEEAKKIKPEVELGGVIEEGHMVTKFGRVAAQTAKQVVIQQLKDAEKEQMITEYEDRIGEIVNASVQRVSRGVVFVDLGQGVGVMPKDEQIPGEYYSAGSRIKVLIKEIDRGERGTQLILSRSDNKFITELFRSEVPELESGAVVINALARDPGVRSKIAVSSDIPGIDPVGTMVGGHGVRIQSVMQEIGEREKIDIINWSDSTSELIYNALSPAEIINVTLDEKKKTAEAFVSQDQQSIAIGRGGQNVRLASQLSGYDIDIKVAGEDKPKKVHRSVEDSLMSTLNEMDDESAESEAEDQDKKTEK